MLMKTTLYAALMDFETELYLESREALLDYLGKELTGNSTAILEI